MNNIKFKVGDRVRIINTNSIEACELNKIGTIVGIQDNNPVWITYIVDMGRPRRPGSEWDDGGTCWYLLGMHIELTSKPNQQLLFDFMQEKQYYGKA